MPAQAYTVQVVNAPTPSTYPYENDTRVPGLGMQQVRDLFGPSVRVMLDWDALVRLDVPVSLRVLTDVGTLYTPWYVDAATGREVPYDHTSDKPLRVRDVVARKDMLNRDRAAAIDAFAGPGGVTSVWTIPCYAVNDTDWLILDGNHRAVAAAAHDLPARILAVVIHGPANAGILPDLAFWNQAQPRR